MTAGTLIRGAGAGVRDAAGTRRVVLRRPSDVEVVSAIALLAYLAAAWVIVIQTHSIIGDAWSRVANAYYILFSRDPHLAAIGFVWNPLPSIAVLPFLPLKLLWPDLTATGFVASIVSAICMAGAVWQLHGMATDWRVRRSARLVVVGLFAFNPMIVYYGANGMSEAMFLFTLIAAARYLARWALGGGVGALSAAGIALAIGYMTRYEAAATAIGAAGVVVILSTMRRDGALRARLEEAVGDAIVFAMPFVITFVAWAVASWLIVGDPFQQFTSVYGVASQLQVVQDTVSQFTGQGTSTAFAWIARQVLGLEPGIVAIGVAAALLMIGRRERGFALVLPILGVIGTVAAFSVFGFLTGRTLGWLRYFISVIPLAAALILALLARVEAVAEAPSSMRLAKIAAEEAELLRDARSRGVRVQGGLKPRAAELRDAGARAAELREGGLRGVARASYRVRGVQRIAPAASVEAPPRRLPFHGPSGRVLGLVLGIAAIAVFAIGDVTSGATILDTTQNPPYGGEAFQLRPVLFGPTTDRIQPTGQYVVGGQAARYLDGLGLRSGTVLVDSAMGFPIVLQSGNPTQFVVTSDRDFQQALADPAAFGVRYLLVPEAVGYQSLDAINRAYPGIYENGAPFVTLVRQFSAGGNNWRLYEVSGQ